MGIVNSLGVFAIGAAIEACGMPGDGDDDTETFGLAVQPTTELACSSAWMEPAAGLAT